MKLVIIVTRRSTRVRYIGSELITRRTIAEESITARCERHRLREGPRAFRVRVSGIYYVGSRARAPRYTIFIVIYARTKLLSVGGRVSYIIYSVLRHNRAAVFQSWRERRTCVYRRNARTCRAGRDMRWRPVDVLRMYARVRRARVYKIYRVHGSRSYGPSRVKYDRSRSSLGSPQIYSDDRLLSAVRERERGGTERARCRHRCLASSRTDHHTGRKINLKRPRRRCARARNAAPLRRMHRTVFVWVFCSTRSTGYRTIRERGRFPSSKRLPNVFGKNLLSPSPELRET